MSNLGVDSLKGNLTNPSRSYLWDVLIPIPIGGGDFATYQIRAQSTQIPQSSTTSIHIDYKQTAGIELAGKKSYEHTWACAFLESEDHKTYDALYAWQQQIVHDVAGVGIGDPLYKTDAYLDLLKVDGSSYTKFKLKGAWLQTIAAVDLNYREDGVITYTATFRFDSFEVITS